MREQLLAYAQYEEEGYLDYYHILILVLPLILGFWPNRIDQVKKSCPALRSKTHVEG